MTTEKETPTELVKRVRDYTEKATPGPWVYGGMIGDPGETLRHFVQNAKGNTVLLSEDFNLDYSGLEKDVQFAANIRTDAPALCDLVERQATELLRFKMGNTVVNNTNADLENKYQKIIKEQAQEIERLKKDAINKLHPCQT